MPHSRRALLAVTAVFLATPPVVFGSMKPGWNPCSADVAAKRFAGTFPYATLRSKEMHYEWAGKADGPVLVMLHGMDSAMPTFDNVVEPLGKHLRILRIDLRGHGKTPDRGLDYWPATLADDVIALAQHLGVRHFHLLGHSYGARVGLRVVERAPAGTVLSFITEDMSFESRYDLEANVAAVARAAEQRRRAFDFPEFRRADLIAELADLLYDGDFDFATDIVRRRTRELGDGKVALLFRPWVSALFSAQAAADEGREVLRHVAIPVLDLRAERGAAARGPVIPPAVLVTIPGSGHVIHRDQPEAFVREVVNFVTTAGGNVQSAPTVIADEGTTPDDPSRTRNMLPRGSALVTSSGDLAAKGITHIIHAATGSSGLSGGAFDPTLESVRLSVLNSLALAKRFGAKRVALPFIGGKIFLGRIGTTPEKLAETIVRAALDGGGSLEIRFVLFDEEQTRMFQRILDAVGPDPAVRALRGNLVSFEDHGSDFIVNAANTEVRFGDGVSGAIGRASGQIRQIDDEARKAIETYYAARR